MDHNYRGVPHIDNSDYIDGELLLQRWNVTWNDIYNRIIDDYLSLDLFEKYKKIEARKKKERELKNKIPHNVDYYIVEFHEAEPFGKSFAEYTKELEPKEISFHIEKEIWPYEEKHPKLKKAAQDFYDKHNYRLLNTTESEKYLIKHLVMPSASNELSDDENHKQKIKWCEEHSIINFDLNRILVNDAQKIHEDHFCNSLPFIRESIIPYHVFEGFPPYCDGLDDKDKESIIAFFLVKKRNFKHLEVANILYKNKNIKSDSLKQKIKRLLKYRKDEKLFEMLIKKYQADF
jgi:hypothetical protein